MPQSGHGTAALANVILQLRSDWSAAAAACYAAEYTYIRKSVEGSVFSGPFYAHMCAHQYTRDMNSIADPLTTKQQAHVDAAYTLLFE